MCPNWFPVTNSKQRVNSSTKRFLTSYSLPKWEDILSASVGPITFALCYNT